MKVIINNNNNSEFEKKTCTCLYLFCVVQEHGLSGTNYVKRHINQIADLMLCRMCDKRGERLSPSECEKLPRRNRKKQDNVAKTAHISSHLSNTSWNGRKNGMNMYHGVLEIDR